MSEAAAARCEDGGSGTLDFREFTVPAAVVADHNPRVMPTEEVERMLQLRFVGRVEELLAQFVDRIGSSDVGEAQRLVEHEELGEAIVSLAWSIDEKQVAISADELIAIRGLSKGLVDRRHLPQRLTERVFDPG